MFPPYASFISRITKSNSSKSQKPHQTCGYSCTTISENTPAPCMVDVFPEFLNLADRRRTVGTFFHLSQPLNIITNLKPYMSDE